MTLTPTDEHLIAMDSKKAINFEILPHRPDYLKNNRGAAGDSNGKINMGLSPSSMHAG
jgi:hypothetical protein